MKITSSCFYKARWAGDCYGNFVEIELVNKNIQLFSVDSSCPGQSCCSSKNPFSSGQAVEKDLSVTLNARLLVLSV